MTGELFSLELVGAGGSLESATVCVDEKAGDEIGVSLKWAGGELSAAAQDAFTAFCEVRERLAESGIKPRCFGACRNIVLSSMAYQMGCGLKGYMVRLGEPARRSDLVHIFGVGPDMDLVSVAEQQDFKRSWLRSLGFGAESSALADRGRI